jgi:phosphate uptake regulator
MAELTPEERLKKIVKDTVEILKDVEKFLERESLERAKEIRRMEDRNKMLHGLAVRAREYTKLVGLI